MPHFNGWCNSVFDISGTPMTRSRFGSRDRLSRDAAELQRLATGLSESGGKLEDRFWEGQLGELVDSLLKNGAEDEINTALDRLFEATPGGPDELADMVESCAETGRLEAPGQEFDIQLFAAPVLAWSRFSIPACPLPKSTLQALNTHLGAHVFGAQARVGLADFLFSPDQLPRSFCDTWQLTQALGQATLAGQHLAVDNSGLPETNRFLSDVRYLVSATAVPAGSPAPARHHRRAPRRGAVPLEREGRQQGGRAQGMDQAGQPESRTAAHRLRLAAVAA